MPASTLIPVEEYLASNYNPDQEYVDGILVERNAGEYDHARLQLLLGVFLAAHEKQWGLRTLVEQRIQIRADRFRIPDVCLLSRSGPIHQVAIEPPLVCIAIREPKDGVLRASNPDIEVPLIELFDKD